MDAISAPIAAAAGVARQLPADGVGMDTQILGDVGLAVSCLFHGVDVDTILFGELSILSHK